MSDIKRIQPGEQLNGLPAHSWNKFGTMYDEWQASGKPSPPPLPQASSGPKPPIIVNTSDVPIAVAFGILMFDAPVTLPANNATVPYQGVALRGITPTQALIDGSRGWCILQLPCGVSSAVPFVRVGMSWVKVDIVNEAHTTCGPVDGQTGFLRSGGGGAKIEWKEEGTGEKWAIVSMGGDPDSSGVYGGLSRVLGTALGTGSTFNIYDIFVVYGPDPRVVPGDAAETLLVKNSLGLALGDGHRVYAEKNKDGEWETWGDTGEGGGGGTTYEGDWGIDKELVESDNKIAIDRRAGTGYDAGAARQYLTQELGVFKYVDAPDDPTPTATVAVTTTGITAASGDTPGTGEGTLKIFNGTTYNSGATGTDLINPTGMPIASGVRVSVRAIVIGETTHYEIIWSDYDHGIPGRTGGSDQSIGHALGGATEWEDDDLCGDE